MNHCIDVAPMPSILKRKPNGTESNHRYHHRIPALGLRLKANHPFEQVWEGVPGMAPPKVDMNTVLNGRTIVAMSEWHGLLVVATDRQLYAITKVGTVELMRFDYDPYEE